MPLHAACFRNRGEAFAFTSVSRTGTHYSNESSHSTLNELRPADIRLGATGAEGRKRSAAAESDNPWPYEMK